MIWCISSNFRAARTDKVRLLIYDNAERYLVRGQCFIVSRLQIDQSCLENIYCIKLQLFYRLWKGEVFFFYLQSALELYSEWQVEHDCIKLYVNATFDTRWYSFGCVCRTIWKINAPLYAFVNLCLFSKIRFLFVPCALVASEYLELQRYWSCQSTSIYSSVVFLITRSGTLPIHPHSPEPARSTSLIFRSYVLQCTFRLWWFGFEAYILHLLQNMKHNIFCVTILLLVKLIAGNEAEPAAATSQVVKLDGDNFQSEVPKGHHFVMFFAPWYVQLN